jgi:hypothetical protein
VPSLGESQGGGHAGRAAPAAAVASRGAAGRTARQADGLRATRGLASSPRGSRVKMNEFPCALSPRGVPARLRRSETEGYNRATRSHGSLNGTNRVVTSLLGALARLDLASLPIPARRGHRPGDLLPILGSVARVGPVFAAAAAEPARGA